MDEPSNGELARRLDDISRLLQGMVSQGQYNAELRLAEHRFTEIERDIEDVRKTHADDIKEVLRRLDDANKDILRNLEQGTKERTSNWRQALYGALIPSILFLASILIQIMQAKGK